MLNKKLQVKDAGSADNANVLLAQTAVGSAVDTVIVLLADRRGQEYL